MKKNLSDYIKTYNNVFTDVECAVIVNELSQANWESHSFYYQDNERRDRVGNDPQNCFDIIGSHDLIVEKVWKTLHQYILTDLNFPWHSGWSGFSAPKYIKYTTGCEMKEHCDHIKPIFDGQRKGIPILTVIVALNDDYEGGELVFLEDETVSLKKGDVVIFPSNFLFPHKVNVVKKGTRYSIAFFTW